MVAKKECVTAALDSGDEILIIYVAFLVISNSNKVHPFCRAPIVLLKINETPTIVSTGYSDFRDIFSLKLVIKLLKYMEINNHTIDFVNGKHLRYRSIYSLGIIKLKTLKIFFKINLAHGFKRPSKYPTNTPIYFIWRPNGKLYPCVNYLKVSIIWPSRIVTCCLWWVRFLIN